MNAAQLFVKALENEGVRYIFGVPGEENLDLLDALRTSSITFITTRHEQSAGFMAATFGRLTGLPGVCLSTLGPGATNLMTAAAYAQLGGMPMLMITGQKPIHKSKQGSFQIVDTVSMMKPVTKLSHQLVHPEKIPAWVRQAFRVATEERPGAVHLELPEDVAAQEVEGDVLSVAKIRRPVAEAKAIATAVEMIEHAKHPLILIGAGANRKQVSKMLTAFIDKTNIPFFETQMGKGVVDERHETYIGTAALSSNDYVHCAVEAADLIINIGHDTIEKPPFIQRADQNVIHINFSPATIDRIYSPQHEVVGDIANAIWQITEKITIQPDWNFEYYKSVKKIISDSITEKSNIDTFPLIPQYIVHQTREALADDAILALDNGMYKLWVTRNYPAYQPNTVLVDNALATMGAGVPSAMAAKLLYPDRQVVAMVGDGGFMMNSQELETAVRLKLNLVIVILNDNGYGMIKWKQQGSGMANFGLEYNNPDFVKYAEAYGAHGYRVDSAENYKKLLSEALSKTGVHIIEVPIDYSENQRFFTEELSKKTCPVFKK